MSAFTFFTSHPEAAAAVEAIWDIDLPNAELAQAVSFKVLPAASPALCVLYRAPAGSDQRINPGSCRQRMTGVRTGAITVRPTGPVGAVIVRLKPEAVWSLTDYIMDEFTDANVALCDLFGPPAISRLEDMLMKRRTDGSEQQ